MGLVQSLLFLYPRLLAFGADQECLPLTKRSLGVATCLVVHCWDRIRIWVSRTANPAFIQAAFGVGGADELPKELPALDNPVSHDLNVLIQRCWILTGKFLAVEIVAEGEDSWFREALVDDSTACGADLTKWMEPFGVTPQ
jgi:hypothetical protein